MLISDIIKRAGSAMLFMIALAAVFSLASCSGNVDEDLTVPEGTLRIFSDKETIEADGVSEVKFMVMFGSEDVTGRPSTVINVVKDGAKTTLASGASSFCTTSPGKYEFSAEYYHNGDVYSDNSVTVMAEEVPDLIKSGFAQRMIAMQFTSIWCTYCPILATAIKSVQESMPGKIIPVAFHMNDMGNDPMTLPINDKFYARASSGSGLPMFALNFRKSSQHIVNEYALIVSEIEAQAALYPALCGVAIETSYDDSARELKVLAKFKSDVKNTYRYHVFLVEDGYVYMQNDDPSYVHDNVLREVKADNIQGMLLNKGEALEEGVEYQASSTFQLAQEWNPSSMRVVVAMLNTYDGGKTYCSNNANECKVGESVDYIFVD